MMVNDTKNNNRKNGSLNKYAFFIVLAAIFIVFSVTQENFLSAYNVLEILKQGSMYCVLLIGLTWVLSVGEIDASFSEIAAFASVLSATFINNGVPVDLAVILVVAISCLFGLLSGIMVTKFKFQAIIATIAISSVARALGLIIAGGKNITLNYTGTFSVFETIASGDVIGIPLMLLFGIGLIVIMVVFQDKMRFGQYVYAIGDNPKAAHNAGIKVNNVVCITFVLSAGFAALGGAMLGLNAGSGRPFMGSLLFLDSFTKVFLGAMVLKLGKTNIVGTFFGCVFLAVISNGLAFVGATAWVQSIVTGGLLILGVLLTTLLERNRQKQSQLDL